MSAVCPACGVAVVPGYVRCPRCHAALPVAASRRNTSTIDPGGTAVARTEMPRWIVWGGVLAGVLVVLYLVIGWISDAFSDYRSSSQKAAPGAAGSDSETPGALPARQAPRATTQPDNNGGGGSPPTTGSPTPPRSAPNPGAPAADLERALRRQRLWSTVEVVGARIDVRSGSCGDRGMPPLIEAARPALRDGGLTRLRCLEQSGRVVFERDL